MTVLTIRVSHVRDGKVVAEEIHQGDTYHVTVGPDACIVTVTRREAPKDEAPVKIVMQGADRGYVMENGNTIAHLPPRGTVSPAQLRTG